MIMSIFECELFESDYIQITQKYLHIFRIIVSLYVYELKKVMVLKVQVLNVHLLKTSGTFPASPGSFLKEFLH